MTRQDKTRQDKTRQDKTRPDGTRQDQTRQDKTRLDKTSKMGQARWDKRERNVSRGVVQMDTRGQRQQQRARQARKE